MPTHLSGASGNRAADLATAHATITARTHYAIVRGELPTLTQDAMGEFRQVSETWHEVCGVGPSVGPLVPHRLWRRQPGPVRPIATTEPRSELTTNPANGTSGDAQRAAHLAEAMTAVDGAAQGQGPDVDGPSRGGSQEPVFELTTDGESEEETLGEDTLTNSDGESEPSTDGESEEEERSGESHSFSVAESIARDWPGLAWDTEGYGPALGELAGDWPTETEDVRMASSADGGSEGERLDRWTAWTERLRNRGRVGYEEASGSDDRSASGRDLESERVERVRLTRPGRLAVVVRVRRPH
jgi:hypothetical protein